MGAAVKASELKLMLLMSMWLKMLCHVEQRLPSLGNDCVDPVADSSATRWDSDAIITAPQTQAECIKAGFALQAVHTLPPSPFPTSWCTPGPCRQAPPNPRLCAWVCTGPGLKMPGRRLSLPASKRWKYSLLKPAARWAPHCLACFGRVHVPQRISRSAASRGGD